MANAKANARDARVNAIPAESTRTPATVSSFRPSASHIPRITQRNDGWDDGGIWHRIHLCSSLKAIASFERLARRACLGGQRRRYTNARSLQDVHWIAARQRGNRTGLKNIVANKKKHLGVRVAPMQLRDGRNIWITFQSCDVEGPTMSVGKFCREGNDRSFSNIHHLRVCLVA